LAWNEFLEEACKHGLEIAYFYLMNRGIICMIFTGIILLFSCKSRTDSHAGDYDFASTPFIPPYHYAAETDQTDTSDELVQNANVLKPAKPRVWVSESEIYNFISDFLTVHDTDKTFFYEGPVSVISKIPESEHTDSSYVKGLKIKEVDNTRDSDLISIRYTIVTGIHSIEFEKRDIKFMLKQIPENSGFTWNHDRIKCSHFIRTAKKSDNGIYHFSVPLFSKDKKSALFTVVYTCKPFLCGNGHTGVFYKENGHWKGNFSEWWVY
jgi:hypothetical protein